MTRIPSHQSDFSRRLRRTMTDAERLLWRHLRLRQAEGWKFRRQHPVGDYIVDFICLEAKLAIEVDGGQHAERIEQDNARTKALETCGLRILRFWNNEVLQDIEAVKAAVWNALPHPHPDLPPGRGKELASSSQGDSPFSPSPSQGDPISSPSPSQGEGWGGGSAP